MSHALRRERTGYPQAKRLVSIMRIPELNEFTIDAHGVLRAGAAVRQQKVSEEPRVRKHWHAIDDAMESVGHTRIRHMLTVGGSVGPLIGGALVAAQWSPQQLLWAAAVAPAISTAVIVTLWLVLGRTPKPADAAEAPALAH